MTVIVPCPFKRICIAQHYTHTTPAIEPSSVDHDGGRSADVAVIVFHWQMTFDNRQHEYTTTIASVLSSLYSGRLSPHALEAVCIKVCPDRDELALKRVKLHLRHKQTNGQTPWIEFGAFSLEMWNLVAILIFLIINWPNFKYSLVDPRL